MNRIKYKRFLKITGLGDGQITRREWLMAHWRLERRWHYREPRPSRTERFVEWIDRTLWLGSNFLRRFFHVTEVQIKGRAC